MHKQHRQAPTLNERLEIIQDGFTQQLSFSNGIANIISKYSPEPGTTFHFSASCTKKNYKEKLTDLFMWMNAIVNTKGGNHE